ncbi:MAG: hypothetical protein ABFC57_08045 [Veillonellales bacterium]
MQAATKQQRTIYPFAALVGQEDLQLGLLLHAVNPRLGGMLIRGEKGTAKSTAVRGLADLLPVIQVVKDCPYHCDPGNQDKACPACRRDAAGRKRPAVMPVPVVELPVSATEDRVVGSLDFEQTIQTGQRAFTPGLMGEANRGIIYIDEINLLRDDEPGGGGTATPAAGPVWFVCDDWRHQRCVSAGGGYKKTGCF